MRLFNILHNKIMRKQNTGTQNWLVLRVPCFVLALFITVFSQALPTDREQPFTTNSDSVELNDKAGTTTLNGNVIIEQGSMRITANSVVLHYSKNAITKVVALGKPAHYSQIPKVGQEPVQAKAKKLEYNIKAETLQLINNASLIQEGGTSLSGNKINYDVKKSIVQAGSDITQQSGKRVKLVIPAKSLENNE